MKSFIINFHRNFCPLKFSKDLVLHKKTPTDCHFAFFSATLIEEIFSSINKSSDYLQV